MADSSTRKRRRTTRTKPVNPGRASARRNAAKADSDAYTEALIESGEAAPVDESGKLPAGATHKIVPDKDGTVKVVRRRFSIA